MRMPPICSWRQGFSLPVPLTGAGLSARRCVSRPTTDAREKSLEKLEVIRQHSERYRGPVAFAEAAPRPSGGPCAVAMPADAPPDGSRAQSMAMAEVTLTVTMATLMARLPSSAPKAAPYSDSSSQSSILSRPSSIDARRAAVGAEASLTAVGEVGAVGAPTVAAVGAGITADALVDTAVSAIAAAVG